MPNIRVTVNNPSPQRISVDQQTRTGVRQIGITSDATLAAGTVQSVSIATSEGLRQSGSPITISGTITITANTASTAQTGIVRLQDSLLSLNTTQALTANMGYYIASLFAGKVQNTFTISTGNGLIGGGDFTTNRTISANDASTTTNGIVRLNDTIVSTNTFQAASANAVNAVQRGVASANATALAAAAAITTVRSGTVNSVTVAASTGLVSSGSPITDSGTITLSANDASLSVNGIVRLTDVTNSTNTYGAATPNSVNTVHRIAVFANTLVSTVNTALYAVRSGTVNSVTIATSTGLVSSGSPITDSGTVSISANDASTTVNGVVRLNDTLTSTNIGQALTANMGVFITSQLIGKVQNTTTISTTSPLAGGGDLSTNRTLSIQAATLTQNGETRLNDTLGSSNNFQAATANVANILARPFIGTYAALVPANTAGNGQFLLTAAGTWVAPPVGGGGGAGISGVVNVANGGTGYTSFVNGQILIGNTASGNLDRSNLTYSPGMLITTGAGNVHIQANVFTGSTTQPGLVPANTAGNGMYVLTAAGTWAAPGSGGGGGGGTVTSVTVAGGNGLVSSGSPVTISGTITVSANDASTTTNGVVRLNDTVTSSNTGQALTANMGRHIVDSLTLSNVSPIGGIRYFGGYNVYSRQYTASATDQPTLLDFSGANTGNLAGDRTYVWRIQTLGTGVLFDSAIYYASVSATNIPSLPYPHLKLNTVNTNQPEIVLTANTYRITSNHASPYVFQVVAEEWPNDTVFPASLGPVAYSHTGGLRMFSTDGANQPIIGQGARVWNENNQGPDSNLHADLLDTFHANAFANVITFNSRSIFTGSGLLGGGPLSSNLTITANDASISVNGIVRLEDTVTSTNTFGAATPRAVKQAYDAAFTVRSGTVNSVSIIAGTGLLQSGSPVTGSGSITVSANDASTSVNGVVRLEDTVTSTNTFQAATPRAVKQAYDAALSVRSATVNSVSIVAGSGLVQSGSPVTGTGSITVTANDASTTTNGVVRLNDTLTSSNTNQALTANMGFLISQQLIGKVQNTFTISTTSPLAGGGDLSTNRTISIQAASLVQNGEVRLEDTVTSSNTFQAATPRAVKQAYDAALSVRSGTVNSVSIVAGSGLVQSGSPVTGTGSITVTANDASITTNGVVRLNDTLTSANIDQALTANMGRYLDAYKVSNTDIFVGSTTRPGLVPANNAGNGMYILTAAGTWVPPGSGGGGGGGTVTSVTVAGGNGLVSSGSPVTISGTITVSANDASTSVNGVVRLEDTVTSTNTFQAATPRAVKQAYDAALAVRSGTVNSVSIVAGSGLVQSGSPVTGTGSITVTANDASTSVNGVVRLEDTVTSTNTFGASTPRVAKLIYDAVLGVRSATVNSVSIIAGSGLVQSGSPITGTGSITVTANDASTTTNGVVRLNDTLTSSNVGQALTANMGFLLSQQLIGKVQNTFTISTTSPLTGGGDLTTNRTLAIQPATLVQNGEVRLEDTVTSTNTFQAATPRAVKQAYDAALAVRSGTVNSVSIVAGSGLVQTGSPVTGTGSITVTANDASTSVNGVVRLEDTVTSTNTFGASTPRVAKFIYDALLGVRSATVNSVSIIAGSGLVQSGSPVTGTGSITVTANDASTTVNGVVRLNDTLSSANLGQALTANMGFLLSQQLIGKVQNTFTISTTSPLTGGGDLSTNRTFAIQAASLTQNGEVRLEDTVTSTNTFQAATPRAVKQAYDAALAVRSGTVNSVSIVAGTGLVQTGSPITGTGSITVTANDASTTVNGVVRLEDTVTSTNTFGASTPRVAKLIYDAALGIRSGTVNSVTIVASTGLVQSGSPVTGSGTITITANDASTLVNGVVRLEDTVTSTNTFGASTPRVAKFIYDALLGVRSATVNSVSIVAGSGLVQSGSPVTGTGSITVTANDASTTTNGVVRLNDTLTSSNTNQALTANMGFLLSQQLVGKVQNTFTISTTSPLTGGGDLSTNRTFAIQAATLTQNGETRLNDTLTSTNTFQALTANQGRALNRVFSTTFDGLVPANNATNNPSGNGQYLLRADGTWTAPGGGAGGSGTVTSVSIIAGTGLVQSGSPITVAGSITVTANDASTSVNGVVRLEDTVTSTNTFQAATPRAVKQAYDAAFTVRSGTVNSVSIVAGTGLVQTGSPVTDTGSITVTANDASTTTNGVVRLNDSLTSANVGQALTANMGFLLSQQLIGKVQNNFTISTTSPLTGGGDLTTNRTFAIQAATLTQNGETRLNDTLTSANLGQALTANMGFLISQQLIGKVQNTRSVFTVGGAITGGGTLAADLTLTIANATTLVNGVVRLQDSLTSSNTGQALTANMGVLIASQLIGKVQNTFTLSTTSPLAGGGDLSTNRTLTIQAASLTQNGEVRLNDTLSSTNTFQALTANQGRALARVFSSTFDGLVPTPGASTGRLLRDDATWVTVSGTGTVTSIDIRPGEGLSNSGGPITGAGSIWVNTVIFTASTNGAVPKSVTADGTKYLRDDATWQTVSATGGGGFSENDLGRVIAVQRGFFL